MNDEDYIRRAIELSLKGSPSPNPYVGAVLVKDGKIISEGYHKKAGQPHAEVEALKCVDAEGATLYVSLEPCSHHGRTPPCTNAIIVAGVSEVVYGMDDPTDKVKGKEVLEAAGVKVRCGILNDECEKINEVFIKYSKTKTPFVVLKSAMTVDGQIATRTGESKWITSEESRRIVHEMRSRYDAVLVGVGTILSDDPQLNCRIEGGRDPVKVVLDSTLKTPGTARVLNGGQTIIATTERADKTKAKQLSEKAEIIVCGKEEVDLKLLLEKLGEKEITSVLVEGGSHVNASFLAADLVDKYVFFIAPKIMGACNTPVFHGREIDGMGSIRKLKFSQVKQVGDDIMVEAYPMK